MKKLQVFAAIMLVALLSLSLSGPVSAAPLATLPQPIQKIYDRTDKAVVDGRPGASWLWGPRVQDNVEDYKESPNGQRQVFYFEKGRLEITNPAKDQADQYYATSGLLLREMITGQEQVGDSLSIDHGPANVPLAGDITPGTADSPTYASLSDLVSFDGTAKSNDLTGQPVELTLGLGGAVKVQPNLSQGVVYAQYYGETGHNVAKPFVDFMNKSGTVYQNGKYVNDQPLFNPLYVFGYPISEPYWAHVTVGGKEQYVLIQAFERRLLTYTPGNADPYKVELGNLGLAYVQWRYNTAPVTTPLDPIYTPPAETDGFKIYNQSNAVMQKLTSLKQVITQGTKPIETDVFEAPNKAYLTGTITIQHKKATAEIIIIGKREYIRATIEGQAPGKWSFIDLPVAFSWPQGNPSFDTIGLNEWSLDWKVGTPVTSGNDQVQPITLATTDLDGTKYDITRLISNKTHFWIDTAATITMGDTKVSQNTAYGEYNKPVNIQPPANATPIGPAEVNDVLAPSIASLPKGAPSLKYLKAAVQPQRVLVKFKSSFSTLSTTAKAQFAARYSDLTVAPNWSAQDDKLPMLYQLNGADLQTTLDQLQADPNVEYASPDYQRHSFISQVNDPQSAQQYYLNVVHAPRAWDASTGSKDITVAVIDSGADVENPDLKGNIAETYNVTNDSTDITDLAGHGSWTTGIIGAIGNNNVYGSGLAWNARILMIRASEDDEPESFFDSNLIKAIHYATDRGARVINMSFGGSKDDPAMRDAVAYATDKGVVVVAASGNDGSDTPSYPASYPKVIAVGATGLLGQPASFSSYGSDVTISAPGVNVCNTATTGIFTCADGTSASAPIVSAAATLILSINPQLTADQVKAILIASARPGPGQNQGQRDDKYGYGVVDVAAAVRMAATNQIPALPQGQ